MALGRAFSVAVLGLDGQIVEIEADITSGLPGVHLVGLHQTRAPAACPSWRQSCQGRTIRLICHALRAPICRTRGVYLII